ncbi:MAG: hypothetical protein JRI44_00215 [Deltaproteobacteria bacterium]|nr:hypothetical protein [Deltaproteobacteria bacterium]
MYPSSNILNMKRSLYRFLAERIDIDINFSMRVKRLKDDPSLWIEIANIQVGEGIRSKCLITFFVCSLIADDPFGNNLEHARDMLIDTLNVDSIPIFDFSIDPENPSSLGKALFIRYKNSYDEKNRGNDEVAVIKVEYILFWVREGIIEGQKWDADYFEVIDPPVRRKRIIEIPTLDGGSVIQQAGYIEEKNIRLYWISNDKLQDYIHSSESEMENGWIIDKVSRNAVEPSLDIYNVTINMHRIIKE